MNAKTPSTAKNQNSSEITEVIKRDGRRVAYDLDRVTHAIEEAMKACQLQPDGTQLTIAQQVEKKLLEVKAQHPSFIPDVEGIQDLVETALIEANLVTVARKYILYRNERAVERERTQEVPDHVKQLVQQSKQYFRNSLSEFVYLRTYARWIESEDRRETWIETVERYIEFMHENLGNKLTADEYNEIRQAILNQEIMPSMRLMQFAGEAARRSNVCAYNCSYIAPSCLRDFAEVMYISMCGTGVGFSVESQNIQALPQIAMQTGDKLPTHVIGDSREGWCDALLLGLETWYAGKDIDFDYSMLRPAGARLRTSGGKSSGPDPLRALLAFVRDVILRRQGRRLSNLDAHDILCKIGEVVVSGGVRRSAMISLSDLDDVAMRDAKKGFFYYTEPQRSMSNNSAVYHEHPSNEVLLDEWQALIKSGSGERGIFNRGSLTKTLPERRLNYLQQHNLIADGRLIGMVGTNPCGEIILQSAQFCNLTEVICRADDTEESLQRKMRLATMLGTYQATLTNFGYLSDKWTQNCEDERLLGVSMTGQWDCALVRDAAVMERLKSAAVAVNAEYAKRFAINQSTCITCVKPSGTVSQVVDCASGMHPRHAPYYIRRIRIAATDALYKMLRAQGVPAHPEVGQTEAEATTFVLEFPVKAPDGAICKDDISALDQLEHWKSVKEYYTEHNPSVTVSVAKNEWIPVVHWLDDNWDLVGGLSFLPRSNHVYQLAPYEAIDEKQYHELVRKMGEIDFSQLVLFEREDETEVKRELACAGGACEIA